jgi:hypothetical protein
MTLVLIDETAPTQLIRRVPQGEARLEKTLRDLLYDNPEALPVHEFDPGYGRLVTVAKELNIPGVGFIDVLLMDERGRLVVVECKLWRNPQARREVVGQILDYARELARYSYEDLQRQVSIATKRQGNVLYALATRVGCTLGEGDFVDRVARDLAVGRFLLLVVGDGITEGTRRIGEYLRDQPGLAFDFGLIEIAEYRVPDGAGGERVMLQPRVLAQTALIERHVIRSEVTGIVIEPVIEPELARSPSAPRPASAAGQGWRRFVELLASETRFDDPAQPPPRIGGSNWTRIPLPQGFYVNAYRSTDSQQIGVQLRLSGAEGQVAWAELLSERDAIDREFTDAGLPAPSWRDGEAPLIVVNEPASLPWSDADEAGQRVWMARMANQFVNSFRPRLQQISGSMVGGH